MRSRSRDIKEEFIFHGKPVVGWSSGLLRDTLTRALDDLVAGEDAPAAPYPSPGAGGEDRSPEREAVGKALGLALSGRRAGALVGAEAGSVRIHDLELAARLHVPLNVVHSVGLSAAPRRRLPRAAVSGILELCAADVQELIDFVLLSIRIAERALAPVIVTEDVIRSPFDVASVLSHDDDLFDVFLGHPGESVSASTSAQKMTLGAMRRRVPSLLDSGRPLGLNPPHPSASEQLLDPGHKAYFAQHLPAMVDAAFDDFGALTGRFYEPVETYRTEDADYVFVTAGTAGNALKSVIDFTRQSSRIRLGAVRLRVVQPAPLGALRLVLAGKRAVTVLDNGTLPVGLFEQAVSQAVETGGPPVHTFRFMRAGSPRIDEWLAAVGNMTTGTAPEKSFFVVPEKAAERTRVPALERLDQILERDYPDVPWLAAVESGASSKASSPVIRIYGERPDMVAEGAGLTAQALATVLNAPVEAWQETGDAPTGFVIDLGSGVQLTAALHSDLLAKDGVLRSITPGATVVVPASMDKKRFWAGQPEVFRRTAAEKQLAVYVTTTRPADDADDPALEPQLRLSALMGGVLRAAFDGKIAIEQVAARLEEVLSRQGFPSQIRSLIASALRDGFSSLERMSISEAATRLPPEPGAPWPLRSDLDQDDTIFDPARFWSSVGFGLDTGRTALLAPDPYLSSRTIPSGVSSSSARRSGKPPEWLPENCTACGLCWTYCPHAALPVTVASVADLIDLGASRTEARGGSTTQVQRLGKHLAKRVHKLIAGDERKAYTVLGSACDDALSELLDAAGLDAETEDAARSEFDAVIGEVRDVPVARTESFFDSREQKARGSGLLVSINVDPDVCTSCGICAEVCPENAIDPAPPDAALLADLRRKRANLSALGVDHAALESVDESFPERLLAHRLIDRSAYYAVTGSGQADPGSGTKMAMHLIAAALTSLARPGCESLRARIAELEDELRQRIKSTLSKSLEVNDLDEFAGRLRALGDQTEALDLSSLLHEGGRDIDTERLRALSEAMLDLESLRDEIAPEGGRRSSIIAVFGDAPTLLRDVQFAGNPLAFPWISAGPGDPFVLAKGIYEGKLREALRVATRLRRAAALVTDTLDSSAGIEVTRDSLTEEEKSLLPSICVFTENLDRAELAAAGNEHAVRVFWLDALSTKSGPAPAAPALADPSWCVAQTTPAQPSHFLDVMRTAAESDGPALVRIHTPEPEADGFPSYRTVARMQRAVSSRVFPLFLYRPEETLEWTERWSLDGNPSPRLDWVEDGESPLTPAEWMAEEGRFARLFEALPRSEWNERQVHLAQYLVMDPGERSGLVPYVETKDSKGSPRRLGLATDLIDASTRFRNSWRLLQELAGVRSSLLDLARRQVETELKGELEAAKAQLRSESEAEIQRIRAGYEETFREKLTSRLLAMSGFDGSSDSLASWLAEIENRGRESVRPAAENGAGG